MEKHSYTGKNKEEAIENAKIDLQELEENLIIRTKEETKGGLFKSKKVEIEVIEKREVVKDLKDFLINLLKNLGFQANIEVKVTDNIPKYTIFSDNDSLLIGKNGKNLQALSKSLIPSKKFTAYWTSKLLNSWEISLLKNPSTIWIKFLATFKQFSFDEITEIS